MGYKSIQCKFTKNERVWLLNDFNLLRRQPEHPRQDVRHRAQKWNVGLERRKERETFCKILHSAKDLGVGIANSIGI